MLQLKDLGDAKVESWQSRHGRDFRSSTYVELRWSVDSGQWGNRKGRGVKAGTSEGPKVGNKERVGGSGKDRAGEYWT